MRSINIVTVLVSIFASFISLNAFALQSENKMSVVKVAKEAGQIEKNERSFAMISGQSLIGSYSAANTIKLESNDENGQLNSKGAYSFGLRSNKVYYKDFGFNWSITGEVNPSFQSRSFNDVREKYTPSGQHLALIIADPSITYGFHRNGYVFGGINYAYPMTSSIMNIKLKSDWGYQIGTGYKINNKWAFEGVFRSVRLRATEEVGATVIDYKNFQMAGIMARAIYHLF